MQIIMNATNVMALGFVFLILGSFEVLISVVAEAKDHQHHACNGLQMITSSPAKIEGVFCSPLTGNGIRFLSDVSEQGTGQFLISSLQGAHLIVAEKPHKYTATIMTILGKHFLVQEDRDPLLKLFSNRVPITEHVIPEKHLQAVKIALYLQDEASLSSYLESEEASVQEEVRAVAANLLSSAQVQLIKEAAEALGNSGVNGKENQAAGVFHFYAMRLVEAQETFLDGRGSAKIESLRNKFVNGINHIIRREKTVKGDKLEQCNNFPTECAAGQCPVGDKCIGMCGPLCHSPCWEFVCGDCCRHEGCYKHDLCCSRDKKSIVLGCVLAVPFKFTCDHYITC